MRRNRNKHILNDRIREDELRIVYPKDLSGVYSKKEALKKAKELGVDLILINNKPSPVICKLQDYQKFTYELKKKEKNNSSKTKHKKIEIGVKSDDHDMSYRAKNAIKFLEKGYQVEVIIDLPRRREYYVYKDQGGEKLDRFLEFINEMSDKDICYTSKHNFKNKKWFNSLKFKK